MCFILIPLLSRLASAAAMQQSSQLGMSVTVYGFHAVCSTQKLAYVCHVNSQSCEVTCESKADCLDSDS